MSEPIFQHPLAYLLGLEGLALLRGWAGDFDEDFTRARLAEIHQLLNDPRLTTHPGVTVARGTLTDAYTSWAPSYDGPNRLFDLDEPFVYGVLDRLPAGQALDAACGTGRFAEGLAQRGHQVIGVDGNAGMLEVACRRVPAATFIQGELDQLPLPDASVDVVTCALALSHVPTLEPVMAEFARVLKPGGHLLISDVHHELVFRGSVVAAPTPTHALTPTSVLAPALADSPNGSPDGAPGLVPTYRHRPGTYLRAALEHQFSVRACEEPGQATPGPSSSPTTPSTEDLGPWRQWPWSLMDLLPTARDAAWDIPLVINWHFQHETGPAHSRPN